MKAKLCGLAGALALLAQAFGAGLDGGIKIQHGPNANSNRVANVTISGASLDELNAGTLTATNEVVAPVIRSSGPTADSEISVADDDESATLAIQAANAMTANVRIIGPATAFGGLAKSTVSSGTNMTLSAAVAGTDYLTKAPVGVAASDETTAITTGTGKVTFRMPYAMTVTGVRATLTTAQSSGSTFTVDINEGGTTILSTKLTLDNGEKTSTTAAAAAVISDTALADDAEITIDVDQVGDGTAKGLKIWIIGN